MTGREKLVRATAGIALITVTSKILGFVRETTLATVFGASKVVDAFVVGQAVPSLLFGIIMAALGTTFIPVFTQTKQDRGTSKAFMMANSVVNLLFLASVVALVFGEIFAPALVHIVAPGFRGDVRDLSVGLSRLMLPLILFQSTVTIFMGMLQTEGSFVLPASLALLTNVIIITFTVTLGPRLGIAAVAMGMILGSALQVVLQLIAVSRKGFRWQPRLDPKDPGVLRIIALAAPVLLSASLGQVNTLVDRMLASGLTTGSVSALSYSYRLVGLVPAILGAAITTVMYPTLSGLVAANEWKSFSGAFAQAVKMIILLLTPVAVGMAVLRTPLVQLTFQRGLFDAQATASTAWALLFYSPAVLGLVLSDIVNKAFFAFQDTRAPMLTGVGAVVLNIVLNLILVRFLAHGGLALATSISIMVNIAALVWVLRKRIRQVSGGACSGIGGRAIADTLLRVGVSSAIMGIAVFSVDGRLDAMIAGQGTMAQATRLFGAVGAGVVVYAVSVLLLRVPEAYSLLGYGRAMLAKARKLTPFRNVRGEA